MSRIDSPRADAGGIVANADAQAAAVHETVAILGKTGRALSFTWKNHAGHDDGGRGT
jgi:hypothetical protein